MTSTDTTQPIVTERVPHRAPKGRLLGVDVVRALAIIGVFVVHFPMTGWLYPGPREETPWLLNWLETQTSSRAMSLFVLLAGVSTALMTGGSRPCAGRRMSVACLRVVVRAATLFLISLCIDEFGASVLAYYAVLLVFLVPFTELRAPTLFALSAVTVPLATLYPIWVMSAHSDWMRAEIPTGLAVPTNPDQWGDYLFSLVFTGGGFQTIYGIPLVLAGLAIGRLDLHSHTVRLRMMYTGFAVAVAAAVGSWLALHRFGAAAAIDTTPPPGMTWQVLFAMPGDRSLYATSAVGITFMIGVALALLGAFLMLMDRPGPQRALWPLAAAGGVAMTWYAGHFLYESAIGNPEAYSFAHFFAVVAATLAASVLWRRWLRRGPLEWLVHTIVTPVVPTRSRATPA